MWKQALDLPTLLLWCQVFLFMCRRGRPELEEVGEVGLIWTASNLLDACCCYIFGNCCQFDCVQEWLSSPSFRTKVPRPETRFVFPQSSIKLFPKALDCGSQVSSKTRVFLTALLVHITQCAAYCTLYQTAQAVVGSSHHLGADLSDPPIVPVQGVHYRISKEVSLRGLSSWGLFLSF